MFNCNQERFQRVVASRQRNLVVIENETRSKVRNQFEVWFYGFIVLSSDTLSDQSTHLFKYRLNPQKCLTRIDVLQTVSNSCKRNKVRN